MKSDTFEIEILTGPRFVLKRACGKTEGEFRSVKDALDHVATLPGGHDAEKHLVDAQRKQMMKVVW
ncbi:MAG: hypothetical protein P4L99_27225 [Chthoniobacter sp.]|nr:hypothetical protein [Chthoniobacter sp.]